MDRNPKLNVLRTAIARFNTALALKLTSKRPRALQSDNALKLGNATLDTLVNNAAQAVANHAQQPNPHNMTPATLNTYSKSEIDQMISERVGRAFSVVDHFGHVADPENCLASCMDGPTHYSAHIPMTMTWCGEIYAFHTTRDQVTSMERTVKITGGGASGSSVPKVSQSSGVCGPSIVLAASNRFVVASRYVSGSWTYFICLRKDVDKATIVNKADISASLIPVAVQTKGREGNLALIETESKLYLLSVSRTSASSYTTRIVPITITNSGQQLAKLSYAEFGSFNGSVVGTESTNSVNIVVGSASTPNVSVIADAGAVLNVGHTQELKPFIIPMLDDSASKLSVRFGTTNYISTRNGQTVQYFCHYVTDVVDLNSNTVTKTPAPVLTLGQQTSGVFYTRVPNFRLVDAPLPAASYSAVGRTLIVYAYSSDFVGLKPFNKLLRIKFDEGTTVAQRLDAIFSPTQYFEESSVSYPRGHALFLGSYRFRTGRTKANSSSQRHDNLLGIGASGIYRATVQPVANTGGLVDIVENGKTLKAETTQFELGAAGETELQQAGLYSLVVPASGSPYLSSFRTFASIGGSGGTGLSVIGDSPATTYTITEQERASALAAARTLAAPGSVADTFIMDFIHPLTANMPALFILYEGCSSYSAAWAAANTTNGHCVRVHILKANGSIPAGTQVTVNDLQVLHTRTVTNTDPLFLVNTVAQDPNRIIAPVTISARSTFNVAYTLLPVITTSLGLGLLNCVIGSLFLNYTSATANNVTGHVGTVFESHIGNYYTDRASSIFYDEEANQFVRVPASALAPIDMRTSARFATYRNASFLNLSQANYVSSSQIVHFSFNITYQTQFYYVYGSIPYTINKTTGILEGGYSPNMDGTQKVVVSLNGMHNYSGPGTVRYSIAKLSGQGSFYSFRYYVGGSYVHDAGDMVVALARHDISAGDSSLRTSIKLFEQPAVGINGKLFSTTPAPNAIVVGVWGANYV